MQKRHFHQKEACIILHLSRENVNNCIRIVVVIKVYTPDTTASVNLVYMCVYIYILYRFLAGAFSLSYSEVLSSNVCLHQSLMFSLHFAQ